MANSQFDQKQKLKRDRYFYGWRDVEIVKANGKRSVKRIPLTELRIQLSKAPLRELETQ